MAAVILLNVELFKILFALIFCAWKSLFPPKNLSYLKAFQLVCETNGSGGLKMTKSSSLTEIILLSAAISFHKNCSIQRVDVLKDMLSKIPSIMHYLLLILILYSRITLLENTIQIYCLFFQEPRIGKLSIFGDSKII